MSVTRFLPEQASEMNNIYHFCEKSVDNRGFGVYGRKSICAEILFHNEMGVYCNCRSVELMTDSIPVVLNKFCRYLF